jgi:amino acid transporter
MTTTDHAASVPVNGANPGLKRNAITFVSGVAIGVASTAPAFSLAATLGFVAAVGGVAIGAPAVILVSFIPMLFLALAFKYMNRADPDCGTTFSWAAKALGPTTGWLGGWAILAAEVIVMADVSQIAAIYTFRLLGWTSALNSTFAVTLLGTAWIVLMTWICWRGIELSARTQRVLLGMEFVTLVLFAVVALITVYVNHPAGSIEPAVSWFNPFRMSAGTLVNGMLLGVFIYWGWDCAVTVTEESEHSHTAPGRAAVVSTLLLVGIYLLVTVAAQSFAGVKGLAANAEDIFSGGLAHSVLGSPWDKLMTLAVLSSAAAATMTTILPVARVALAMARQNAFPSAFARTHPRNQTPNVGTIAMGVASVVWYVLIVNVSTDVLADSVTALGFAVCAYYGMTGYACAVYYRRELLKSARNLIYVGILPVLGALVLTGIFVKAAVFYSHPGNTSSQPIFGVGAPVMIGVGLLLLGVVAMLIARLRYRDFFNRKPEVAEPGLLDGEIEPAAGAELFTRPAVTSADQPQSIT